MLPRNNYLVQRTKTKNVTKRRGVGIFLVKEVWDVVVNVLQIYLRSKIKTEVV
jgi:hypothetical protein